MITHYCLIRHHTIILDGKTVVTGAGNALSEFLLEAYESLKIEYPKYYKMDHLSKLGLLASEVLLRNSRLSHEYSPENISIVLSNSSGSLDSDTKYWESAKSMASPALFVYTLPNIVAGEICIRHKIKGENAFFISPSFDATLIADYVDSILSPTPANPNVQSLMPSAILGGWVEVLGEHHDVFLYLMEKNKPGLFSHTAEQLNEIYHRALWKS